MQQRISMRRLQSRASRMGQAVLTGGNAATALARERGQRERPPRHLAAAAGNPVMVDSGKSEALAGVSIRM